MITPTLPLQECKDPGVGPSKPDGRKQTSDIRHQTSDITLPFSKLTAAYVYGSPVRTVEDEYAKVRASARGAACESLGQRPRIARD